MTKVMHSKKKGFQRKMTSVEKGFVFGSLNSNQHMNTYINDHTSLLNLIFRRFIATKQRRAQA